MWGEILEDNSFCTAVELSKMTHLTLRMLHDFFTHEMRGAFRLFAKILPRAHFCQLDLDYIDIEHLETGGAIIEDWQDGISQCGLSLYDNKILFRFGRRPPAESWASLSEQQARFVRSVPHTYKYIAAYTSPCKLFGYRFAG